MAGKNLIEATLPTERSRKLVSKMIPILVRWAQSRQTNKTYGDMIHAIGYSRFSGIAKQLAFVEDVMRAFRKAHNLNAETLPTLNALCNSPKDNLPSGGFSYVYPNYEKLSETEKRVFVAGINAKAVSYEHWDWVLDELGLQPVKILTEEELENVGSHGFGGEGEEHKALKEYILNHPESIEIKKVKRSEAEFHLPSGDRLDVFFEVNCGDKTAIEVKPSSSPDDDIARGIFQCVKYKAVMEAMKKIVYGNYQNFTLLVMAGTISEKNRQLADALDIKYIDNFQMK